MPLEPPTLSALQRPSGAFAMVAIDQRESMRAMFLEAGHATVGDEMLVSFKLEAARALSPIASAMLLDQEFAWQPAIATGAVAPDCALIAAVDRFFPSSTEIVGEVEFDQRIDIPALKADGAKALKLLVLWRPDEDPSKRIRMVEEFVQLCRSHDLLSIIEPVSRAARDGSTTDLSAGIIQAANELGDRGQDLYKAEVPLYGNGSEDTVRRECAQLNSKIQSPWVVLSAGVAADRFCKTVEWACKEGASGFLAGRAVWKASLQQSNFKPAFIEDAVVRLKRLCDVVDSVLQRGAQSSC